MKTFCVKFGISVQCELSDPVNCHVLKENWHCIHPKFVQLMYVLRNKGTDTHWTEMPNFARKVFMRLYCLDMTFSHTTGLLRYQGSQEKWKRPMKVVKAKSKASESKITKVYNFFILLWSFSVLYSHISVFFSFKDIKAKKAALVTRNAKMN